ncbi:CUE domain [Musa troglodytarum]|uniref:CUE domain n=1 Tax=Musa troglodytarum TaxID=320322 RepID=A0A9E7K220_9LILI|nr:CUE domain [Musa troglodytarum]
MQGVGSRRVSFAWLWRGWLSQSMAFMLPVGFFFDSHGVVLWPHDPNKVIHTWEEEGCPSIKHSNEDVMNTCL